MKKDDLIYHLTHKVYGVVASTPRAHSSHVRCLLDGNIAPQYYPASEIIPQESRSQLDAAPIPPAVPAPPHSPASEIFGNGPKIPNPPPPPESPTIKPDPVRVSMPVPRPPAGPLDSYNGDLTLDRLLVQQTDLRRRMEALDEAIMQVRVYTMIRRSMEGLQYRGEVDLRCQASVDAMRMKNDTQKLLDAANRLAAQGKL